MDTILARCSVPPLTRSSGELNNDEVAEDVDLIGLIRVLSDTPR